MTPSSQNQYSTKLSYIRKQLREGDSNPRDAVMSRGWDLSSYPAIRYAPKRVNGRSYLCTVIRFQITNGAFCKVSSARWSSALTIYYCNFIRLRPTFSLTLLNNYIINFLIFQTYDILNYWFKAHTPRQGCSNRVRRRPPQYCDRSVCLPAGGL